MMSWFLAIVLILVGILLLANLVRAQALIKMVSVQNNFLRSLLFSQMEPPEPGESD